MRYGIGVVPACAATPVTVTSSQRIACPLDDTLGTLVTQLAVGIAGQALPVDVRVVGPLIETLNELTGLATGSQQNLILTTEEMVKATGNETRRLIPPHEERLKDRFPSRITKNGLRVTEICLADNAKSMVA